MRPLFPILLILLCFTSCKDATKEIFTNYTKYENEISMLQNYFKKIKPKDLILFIRFNSDNNIDFKLNQKNYDDKVSWRSETIFDDYGQFHKFGVSLDDKEIQKALSIIKWDCKIIELLKTLLDNANCESIGNNFSFSNKFPKSYISIGYPTNDLYGLEYLIFESTINTKEANEILKSCSLKKINSQTLVRYGGPSFGTDCFPDKK